MKRQSVVPDASGWGWYARGTPRLKRVLTDSVHQVAGQMNVADHGPKDARALACNVESSKVREHQFLNDHATALMPMMDDISEHTFQTRLPRTSPALPPALGTTP